MNMRHFLRAGHAPTMFCAFLYFDISFMVWVLIGALAPSIKEQFRLDDFENGFLIALPILGGALLRLVLGVLTDHIGARRTGLIGLTLTLAPLLLGWLWADHFSKLLLVGLLLGVASRALAEELTSSCTDNPSTNTTTCRIDNPIVTERMTEYDGAFHPEIFEAFGQCNIFGCNQRFGINLPGIFLRRGDLVTVDADGCVQTGGSGSTWKRYVDPQGTNSDRLYHGRLILPGLGDMRIDDFMNWYGGTWVAPGNRGDYFQSFYLSYEDDGPFDNGYYAHDNGTGNQCLNVGSAWVNLTIIHQNLN